MIVRRLCEDETINSFYCGDSDLDDFILNEASLYRNSLLSVHYVMEEEDNFVAFLVCPMTRFQYMTLRIKLNSIVSEVVSLSIRKE